MEKCVIDLFCAVTQINSRYYNTIGVRQNQTNYPQETEQSFSAELFHRFKSIIELPVNSEYYRNLILHFDITKAAVQMRPDMVLHENQENRNNQKMFIEVKTDSGVDLNVDFNKIKVATEEYLHFQNVVMIIANRSFEDTLEEMIVYFNELPIIQKDKIYLITAELIDINNIDYNIYSFRNQI